MEINDFHGTDLHLQRGGTPTVKKTRCQPLPARREPFPRRFQGKVGRAFRNYTRNIGVLDWFFKTCCSRCLLCCKIVNAIENKHNGLPHRMGAPHTKTTVPRLNHNNEPETLNRTNLAFLLRVVYSCCVYLLLTAPIIEITKCHRNLLWSQTGHGTVGAVACTPMYLANRSANAKLASGVRLSLSRLSF